MDEIDYTNDKINVSDLFADIYINFNVMSQIERMNQLTKSELYLLLTLCLDKFSENDPVVIYNFLPFKEEIMAIYDIQDDKDPIDEVLIDLIAKTGDKYIETSNIVYDNYKKLPDPLTKDQVRDAKINIINKK